MSAGRHTFLIEQGATWEARLDYRDSDNNPIDLTYWEGRMHIRPQISSDTVYCYLSSSLDSDGTGITFTPVSGSVTLPRSSGSIGLYISAASSSNFSFKEGYFDLEIYSGSRVDRIMEGKIKVSPNVTR